MHLKTKFPYMGMFDWPKSIFLSAKWKPVYEFHIMVIRHEGSKCNNKGDIEDFK